MILNSEYLKTLRNKTKARKNKFVHGFRTIAIAYHITSSAIRSMQKCYPIIIVMNLL